MSNRSLFDQVSASANVGAVIVAVLTILTSNQSSRLAEERRRNGGARKQALREIRFRSSALAATTLATLLASAPLVVSIVSDIGKPRWEPILALFLIACFVLCVILCWQVQIAINSA